MENLPKTNYQKLFEIIINDYLPRIAIALLILFVGLWLTRFLTKAIKHFMEKREVELTLRNFLANLTFWTLRVLLFITVISKLGVETSAFITVLGAAGLAIGLSLQGSLANFAGGILIILFKPFKVGDKIEAQGETGIVEDIQIFSTKLITTFREVVYIPNGILSNGKIKNFTQLPSKKVSVIFSVSNLKDFDVFADALKKELSSNNLINKEYSPQVNIDSIEKDCVNINISVLAKNTETAIAKSDILESCQKVLSL